MNSSIPPDDYAPQVKRCSGTVNRLRGWVGTDESKTTELADALVELTTHRFRSRAFAEAAAEAQESLNLAGKIVSAHGPIGPYTPPPAAARLVSALVQVATMLTEAGQSEVASQTMATAVGLIEDLRTHQVQVQLSDELSTWALITQSRIALADNDIARANACIDAARPGVEMQEFDRLQTLAAARWAAGEVEQSIVAAWRAVDVFEGGWQPLREAVSRLAPARLARITRPMFGLYSDLADRHAASGDFNTALVARRRLIFRLESVADLRPGLGPAELSAARRALAEDLTRAGRNFEADQFRQMPGVAEAPVRRQLEVVTQKVLWFMLRPEEPFVGAMLPVASELTEINARLEADREESALYERIRMEDVERERRGRVTNKAAAAAKARIARQKARAKSAQPKPAVVEVDVPPPSQRTERLAAYEKAQREREAELLAAARRAPDELAAAKARLDVGRVTGDKQAAYAAAQDVVIELRGRFTGDPTVAPELILALQDLAITQRQAGDWWGSRKPAKEAKELARRWADERTS